MRIGSAVQPSAAPSVGGSQPRPSDHQQHDIALVERVVDDLPEVGARRNVVDVEKDVVFSAEPAKAKMIAESPRCAEGVGPSIAHEDPLPHAANTAIPDCTDPQFVGGTRPMTAANRSHRARGPTRLTTGGLIRCVDGGGANPLLRGDLMSRLNSPVVITTWGGSSAGRRCCWRSSWASSSSNPAE